MSQVLVVDDEAGFREELATVLTDSGYDVLTARTGREAIEVGARERPHVLVADWLLRNHIHGLHVTEVLRTVCPAMQTIMMTGFSTQDLRAEAERLHVYRFMEKPFGCEQIRRAVAEADHAAAPPPLPLSVAVAETDAEGRILYANDAARTLFATTAAGPEASRFDELLVDTDMHKFEDLGAEWAALQVRGSAPATWWVRARVGDGDSRLVVFLPATSQHRSGYPVVRMLLGLNAPRVTPVPFEGRVLIVDPSDMVRQVLIAAFDRFEVTCHAAANVDSALHLLAGDPQVAVALLDYDAQQGQMDRLIATLRVRCPTAHLIGTSAQDSRQEWAELGVDGFLPKPYTVVDVFDAMKAAGVSRRTEPCG